MRTAPHAALLRPLRRALTLWILVAASASASHAGVTWTVSAFVSDGVPLDALNTTSQIVVDITARTDDQLVYELDASAVGYDPALLSFRSAIVSQSLLGGFALAPGWTLSGVDNAIATPVEQLVGGAGQVRFLDGTATQTPTLGDGSLDLSPVDLTTGGPQFRLVFDWIGGVGATELAIGTFAEFGDTFIGGSGAVVENAFVSLAVIPEPGTALLLAVGLAGLAWRRRAS